MKQANALSLRYRPQRFADVIGQEVACRIFSKACITNSVAPAYILSGTRGVGKTTLARIFAKALNCENIQQGEPCNECSHCTRITRGNFVDVIELDAASHRSIDDIRDLRETVGFSPMEGRYKIFILDEAHMLTKEAYNALLKTLEEPPPFVVFIFASTDIQKFPATIISRCQHIILKSVPTQILVQHLSKVLDSEGVEYTKDAVECIARRGFGSVRDSLSILGQVLVGVQGQVTKAFVEEMLGLASHDIYLSILRAMMQGNTLQVVEISHTLLEKGIDIKYFLQELTSVYRTLFLTKQHGKEALLLIGVQEEEHKEYLEFVTMFSLTHIHACWQMVLHGQKKILDSLEPSVALELLLLNIVSLRSLLPITEYTMPSVLEGGTAVNCDEGKEQSQKSISAENNIGVEKKELHSNNTNFETMSEDRDIHTTVEQGIKESEVNNGEDRANIIKEEQKLEEDIVEDAQSKNRSNILEQDIQEQRENKEIEENVEKNRKYTHSTEKYMDSSHIKERYPIIGMLEEEFNSECSITIKRGNT